ncbi:COG2426 family protein [Oceanivirga miroungae]|uniref:Small multi-drug export n=1 Tax=Oceanivirga miroungae TaxID=1130046 RepID=A0A6I8M693_9FUSO|nr:small multi-drug export protein [Oceanivirga miroungae]VWL85409.1 small multi-drug export [Oceanivirga miroungae]
MIYLHLFIISMLPLIELRGAIIYAAVYKLNIFLSIAICVLGNIIVIPIIYIFAMKTIDLLAKIKYTKKIADFILHKGHKAALKLKAKKSSYIALLLFVGIPLPGTGVWTGTLASILLGLDPKKSFVAMLFGCILASIIMYLSLYVVI